MSTTALVAYRHLIADVYELAGTSRRTGDAIARALNQTAARWHVLSVLSDQPCTAAGTARRLGLARQGVQRVVNELLAQGLLAVADNPAHRRSPLFSLTTHGRRCLDDIVRASDSDRTELLRASGLTAEQLDSARAVVRELISAFDARDRRSPGATLT